MINENCAFNAKYFPIFPFVVILSNGCAPENPDDVDDNIKSRCSAGVVKAIVERTFFLRHQVELNSEERQSKTIKIAGSG